VTGKFIQEDPIGFLAGINLYRYVLNNPVERTDSWGFGSNIDDTLNIKETEWFMGFLNFGAGMAATMAAVGGTMTYVGYGCFVVGGAATVSTVAAPLTIAAVSYYAYGRFKTANEQLTAAEKGEKPTFNYNDKCEAVKASPFGPVPGAKSIANLWFPEGSTSVAAEEAAKDILKVILKTQLSNLQW